MSRIGWFHCASGASGDMVLGALVDAGVPVEHLQEVLDGLPVERVTLSAETVTRQSLGATLVHVAVERSTVVRTWPHVRDLIESADLPEPVRRTALDVFERLALAEAAIHRTSAELVHFHEIGGLDAIADIVGAAAGLHHLGLDAVAASPIATGMGMTRSDHGMLPVPTPAVLEVLRGVPVYSGGVPYELCTPTGAAILSGVVTTWGELPAMTVDRVGTGAGTRDLDEMPNVLRLVIGEAQPASAAGAPGVVVEANVDDLDPRLWPGVLSALLAVGAADAWLTPMHMKKGRPAVTVSALCTVAELEAIRGVLFRETSTIGVREHEVTKRALERELITVALADGSEVRVKVARLDGRVVNASPEFDDVTAAAAANGRPVKAVLAEAAAAAHEATR
ncbi:MAG TPA: nickel pincer cofactor biosynthesis protein LarC [Mycobacteriales bacterium]|nr:nickel pincer cofactor biosynthesis protein LarC [Mycobacteriales bacterium]